MKMFVVSAMLMAALNAPSFASERDNVHKGESLSLEKAIAIAVNEVPGKVIEAELDDGIYKVNILTADGERIKLKIDPRDGTLIRKGKILKGVSKGFSKSE